MVLSISFCLGGSQTVPKGANCPRNLFSEESGLQQELPQTLGNEGSWLSPLLRAPGWRAGQGSEQGRAPWSLGHGGGSTQVDFQGQEGSRARVPSHGGVGAPFPAGRGGNPSSSPLRVKHLLCLHLPTPVPPLHRMAGPNAPPMPPSHALAPAPSQAPAPSVFCSPHPPPASALQEPPTPCQSQGEAISVRSGRERLGGQPSWGPLSWPWHTRSQANRWRECGE